MIDIKDFNVEKNIALLSNLSFDHPLNSNELNDLIEMLSSSISIGQVYFKGDIDVGSIERIKLLLEGLPNILDDNIEKYIMKSISKEEKEQLIQMNFQNIDTWNIAYSIEHNKYSVTSLPKYRLIDEWFNTTLKEIPRKYSQLEKICFLYDKVKLFQFDSNSKFGRLPEIISNLTANSYGYNLVFSQLLHLCKIPNFIEKYELENEENYVTVAEVNDEKYGLSGIYLFEPSMDTISKDKYKNVLARRINYNFFALSIDKFLNQKENVIPCGLLKVLSSQDELEYKYYLDKYKNKYGVGETSKIEEEFTYDLDKLYYKMSSTNELDQRTFINILDYNLPINTTNNEENTNIKNAIIRNFHERDKEIFNVNLSKQMSIKQII